MKCYEGEWMMFFLQNENKENTLFKVISKATQNVYLNMCSNALQKLCKGDNSMIKIALEPIDNQTNGDILNNRERIVIV